jgi:hypothetical protein
MLRRIIGSALALFLTTGIAAAQAAATQIFTLPNTAASSQWVKLGTFNASQQGYHVDVKIVSSSGYNASADQDQISYIHMKTSNAQSVDANGFAGDSWWYQTGPNTGAPSQVVWVANAAGTAATTFTLFASFGLYTGDASYYVVDTPYGTTWTNSAVGGQTNPGSGGSTVLVAQNKFFVGSNSAFSGSVGIGTTSPNAKLEVNGNINLTASSGAHMTYADGTVQSTAWTGVLSGGDYAESVDVAGERLDYLPGDVLMIDPEHPDRFRKASEPYSRMVAGIYSTKPGITGRRQPTVKSKEEIPMAMIGIVPAKVSTENGPVLPGDLLVASSTPGYAMKGTDKDKLTGAIIGKAMGHLEQGKGLIEVLVTLQ